MKYVVNENCIGCGLCVSTCPDYFTMADTGVAVAMDAPVPTAHEGEATNAAYGCPVGAIEQVEQKQSGESRAVFQLFTSAHNIDMQTEYVIL